MKKSELKALKGKKVECYDGVKGKIVKATTFKKQNKVVNYDNSGWLGKNAHKEFDLKKSDVIVAVKRKDGSTEVYTLGNGGADLIDKKSKTKDE